MNTRWQIAIPCVVAGIALLNGNLPDATAEKPQSRKVRFFDLWKLDHWQNLELRQGEPRWEPRCDYRDPNFANSGVYFPSVWVDQPSGSWRMVHSVKWSPFTLMAAQSEDGIDWRPLPVDTIDGHEQLANNHLLTVPGGSGGGVYHDRNASDGFPFRIFGRQSGQPVVDRVRNDASHPLYHHVVSGGHQRVVEEGITMVSKDGLHWETRFGSTWNWQADDWYPEPPVFAFWNPHQQRHVMLARPGWGDRRQCIRTSSDLQNWSDPELLFQPDSLDTQSPIGMYGMPVFPLPDGGGFVGLLWIFHNSNSEPVESFNQFFGTMDPELTYSYDGIRFFRAKRKPFLARNPIPEPGCIQIRPCSFVETDEEIFIYSEGHRGAHGRERSEQRASDLPLGGLLLHRLRKDGWMYLTSRGDWASFQTKPLVLRAPGIRINAAADFGEVRFQLTDEKSVPIEGFTFNDCIPLRRSDSLAYEVAWKETPDWSNVLNRPVRFEVKFRQANIYSLDMVHHFLDAHDMWMLKDGKTLPARPRFDF